MQTARALAVFSFCLTACPAEKATPPAADAPRSAPASGPASAPASGPASAPTSGPAEHSSKGTTPETRNQVDPDGVVRRGVAVAHDEAMTVAALLEQVDSVDGKLVTVTGEVDRVCSKKGCWMALRGEEGSPSVRVTSKGYAYFVPNKSIGMTATVKGEVKKRTLDPALARHYAKESGGKPAKATGGQLELTIASIGLELRP